MNIVIFGATGGTGRSAVEQALAEGHKVLAFDRNPAALAIEHPNLSVVGGDVFNVEQVENAVRGQDAVICVLGVRPETQKPVCSVGTENIVAAMKKFGVKRLICQTAFAVAAVDGEWIEVPWLSAILPFFPKTRAMFEDKVRQEASVRQSDLDWIIVRPAQLTNTAKTGMYKVGVPLPMSPAAKISREDVADFLLKQVNDDTYLHQVPRLKH